MERRNFIKTLCVALPGTYLLGCTDDSETEVLVPDPEIPELNKTPYIISNDSGITTKFAVIGDVHGNGNILKGALEEVERLGIKDVLLVGDQADSFMTDSYIEGYSEPEAYMQMIVEKKFDTRLNLYPVRGNHEGVKSHFDNSLSSDIFDRIKSDWQRTFGQLLKQNKKHYKTGLHSRR